MGAQAKSLYTFTFIPDNDILSENTGFDILSGYNILLEILIGIFVLNHCKNAESGSDVNSLTFSINTSTELDPI